MGKARILSNLEDGLYSVALIVRGKNGQEQNGPTVNAWCVDHSTELEPGSIVGTMEVGGTGMEYRDGATVWVRLIKPGFEDASWGDGDGILSGPGSLSPSAFFYNAGIHPGWQRWRPTVRTGRILSLDEDNGTADICMRPALDYARGTALEPKSLPECDMGEPVPENDFHIQQAQIFCENNPGHPMCQEFGARTAVSYDTWWPIIVDINTQVNKGITYQRDPAGQDVWDVVSLPGTGDCEDYALTKMQMLHQAGIPASALGLALGKLGSGPARGNRDIDHAWAVVFTDKGIYHLEQAPDIPKGFQPGSNFQILRYNRFEILARKLSGVPIRYMDCDAEAFEEGDDVVVQFDGQSWSSPAVVGFSYAPKPCLVGKTLIVSLMQESLQALMHTSIGWREYDGYVSVRETQEQTSPYVGEPTQHWHDDLGALEEKYFSGDNEYKHAFVLGQYSGSVSVWAIDIPEPDGWLVPVSAGGASLLPDYIERRWLSVSGAAVGVINAQRLYNACRFIYDADLGIWVPPERVVINLLRWFEDVWDANHNYYVVRVAPIKEVLQRLEDDGIPCELRFRDVSCKRHLRHFADEILGE